MSGKRRNFRATFAAACVLLVGIAGLLMSVTGGMRGARADLTDDKRFTMSPAAAEILKGLKVPVQVKLYITPADEMPTRLKNLERDIVEQLGNFNRVSRGMLEYEVLNPQDDEDMQERLVRKGIRPFQEQSVDKDEFGVKLVWSALTIAYKDNPEEIIPRLDPATMGNFESLVISPVYRLTREEDPMVAVFAPLQEVDQQLAMMYLQQGMQPPEPTDQFSMIQELLEQQHYEVARIDLTADSPVPADADLLLVLDPHDLNPRQAWEINRALSNGIPVFVAAQAHTYNYAPAPRGGWSITGEPQTSGLEAMLAGFGLTVVTDHFMDQSMQMLELPREVNLGGIRMQTREPVKAPIQILVTGSTMNEDSELTNRIGALLYLWGTPIDYDAAKLAEHELNLTTLMSSSDQCWRAEFTAGPVTPEIFDPNRNEMLGGQPLAVLVEGQFPDTFAGEEIPAWPEESPAAVEGDEAATEDEETEGPAPATLLDPQPGRLVLVGCGKMFDDNILQGAQNALLLLNAVDFLAGSEQLLSIRTKNLTQRVIRQTSAGHKVFFLFFTVALVPLAIAIFGFARSTLRRKEASRYRAMLRRGTAAGV